MKFKYKTLLAGMFAVSLTGCGGEISSKGANPASSANVDGSSVFVESAVTDGSGGEYVPVIPVSEVPSTPSNPCDVYHDPDSFEPNDTNCDAYPLSIDGSKPLTSFLTKDDRVDVYSFDVKAGKKYSVSLMELDSANPSTWARMMVSIATESGEKLTGNDYVYAASFYAFNFTSSTTQKAYVTIKSNTTDSYHYRLNAFAEPDVVTIHHDELSYEPNNVLLAAYPASLGSQIVSQTTADDPVDYFVFDVTPGQEMNVYLSDNSASNIRYNNSLTWSIKDDTGYQYFGSEVVTGGSTKTHNFKVLAGRKLYVRVANYLSNGATFSKTSHAYELSVY